MAQIASASVRQASAVDAAAAHQFEHVRIALLRHDRGAGREGIGQLDEGELLGIEQQQIGRQPAQVLHQQRELEQQLRLGLAARELHRGHRFLRDIEAERARGGVAIERQSRGAVAGRRAQRDSSRCADARS